jgi:hypothetical protein
MPQPGTSVALSAAYTPAHLWGLTIHPNEPFTFDFLVHRGDEEQPETVKKNEYSRLVKYFLAALAVPDTDQWVNLSPYEQDRIIPDNFGLTEMGRDLLAQDYLLKQLASSLTDPDSDLGKKFWQGVYAQAKERFGTTDVPTDLFNKVWIAPDKAVVFEKSGTVYVLESHLKVMLEQDYLAMKNNTVKESAGQGDAVADISTRVMRDIIVPALEQEVNTGRGFAPLRQVYSGMLLATWYKRALKETILGQLYANQSKVKGVDQDPQANQVIYDQYVAAFRKGVFNIIKEEVDQDTQEVTPRKYFSGGTVNAFDSAMSFENNPTVAAPVISDNAQKTDLAQIHFQNSSGVQDQADTAMAVEVFSALRQLKAWFPDDSILEGLRTIQDVISYARRQSGLSPLSPHKAELEQMISRLSVQSETSDAAMMANGVRQHIQNSLLGLYKDNEGLKQGLLQIKTLVGLMTFVGQRINDVGRIIERVQSEHSKLSVTDFGASLRITNHVEALQREVKLLELYWSQLTVANLLSVSEEPATSVQEADRAMKAEIASAIRQLGEWFGSDAEILNGFITKQEVLQYMRKQSGLSPLSPHKAELEAMIQKLEQQDAAQISDAAQLVETKALEVLGVLKEMYKENAAVVSGIDALSGSDAVFEWVAARIRGIEAGIDQNSEGLNGTLRTEINALLTQVQLILGAQRAYIFLLWQAPKTAREKYYSKADITVKESIDLVYTGLTNLYLLGNGDRNLNEQEKQTLSSFADSSDLEVLLAFINQRISSLEQMRGNLQDTRPSFELTEAFFIGSARQYKIEIATVEQALLEEYKIQLNAAIQRSKYPDSQLAEQAWLRAKKALMSLYFNGMNWGAFIRLLSLSKGPDGYLWIANRRNTLFLKVNQLNSDIIHKTLASEAQIQAWQKTITDLMAEVHVLDTHMLSIIGPAMVEGSIMQYRSGSDAAMSVVLDPITARKDLMLLYREDSVMQASLRDNVGSAGDLIQFVNARIAEIDTKIAADEKMWQEQDDLVKRRNQYRIAADRQALETTKNHLASVKDGLLLYINEQSTTDAAMQVGIGLDVQSLEKKAAEVFATFFDYKLAPTDRKGFLITQLVGLSVLDLRTFATVIERTLPSYVADIMGQASVDRTDVGVTHSDANNSGSDFVDKLNQDKDLFLTLINQVKENKVKVIADHLTVSVGIVPLLSKRWDEPVAVLMAGLSAQEINSVRSQVFANLSEQQRLGRSLVTTDVPLLRAYSLNKVETLASHIISALTLNDKAHLKDILTRLSPDEIALLSENITRLSNGLSNANVLVQTFTELATAARDAAMMGGALVQAFFIRKAFFSGVDGESKVRARLDSFVKDPNYSYRSVLGVVQEIKQEIQTLQQTHPSGKEREDEQLIGIIDDFISKMQRSESGTVDAAMRDNTEYGAIAISLAKTYFKDGNMVGATVRGSRLLEDLFNKKGISGLKNLRPKVVLVFAKMESQGPKEEQLLTFIDLFISGKESGVDAAMATEVQGQNMVNPGGIDFAESNLDMQIQRDAKGVPLPVNQQHLEGIRIDGLVPVIINIRPATPALLLSQAGLPEPAAV